MDWDKLLQWITDHKDALGWLFGTGIVGALLGGLYKLIRWIIELRRERQRGGEGQPFIIIPPGGDVLAVALPDPLDSLLNDRRIPYVERLPGRSVRREMEDLLLQQRALLVCGKSGLGKTREAAHLAQTLSAEGWTVLFLPPDRWLEPPARRLEGVPDHKLLLFVDDLSRRCGSGRREVNPRADSLAQPLTLPFQERLLKTLRACFAAICGDIEEALRLLDIAPQKRQTSRQWARQAPDLRALHGHPRFEQLTAS